MAEGQFEQLVDIVVQSRNNPLALVNRINDVAIGLVDLRDRLHQIETLMATLQPAKTNGLHDLRGVSDVCVGVPSHTPAEMQVK